MSNTCNVEIYEIIKTNSASLDTQGNQVFDEIVKLFDSCDKINVDFTRIQILTTAFLNNAIGKLFFKYKSDLVINKIRFVNLIDKGDVEALSLVLEGAYLKSLR